MKILQTTKLKQRYTYQGPVFQFGKYVETLKDEIETIAVSKDEAYRNFNSQVKKLKGLTDRAQLTIDRSKIKLDPKESIRDKKAEPVTHQPSAKTSDNNLPSIDDLMDPNRYTLTSPDGIFVYLSEDGTEYIIEDGKVIEYDGDRYK